MTKMQVSGAGQYDISKVLLEIIFNFMDMHTSDIDLYNDPGYNNLL